MPSLYEIDKYITSCIDEETGEIINAKELSELAVERDKKIENVALWIKNLTAEAAMYKAEEETFKKRCQSALNLAESLKKWLSDALSGCNFSTSKVDVRFRKSESVECDETMIPKEYLAEKIEYKPNKRLIKFYLKSGRKIPGCSIVERKNIQIK